MRTIFRWLRRVLSMIFILGVIGGTGYFIYFTTTGIIDEVEFRREQARRDIHREQTVTFLAPTIDAESEILASYEVGEENVDLEPSGQSVDGNNPDAANPPVQRDTETPALTSTSTTAAASSTNTKTPTVTESPEPTATSTNTTTPTYTSTPTDPPIPTGLPTNTAYPTAIPTNTPYPTDTLSPTSTLSPTNTVTPSNTPTPTSTFTPTNTPTSTPTPRPTLVIEGTYDTPVNTPIAAIQLSAPLVEDSDDIVNIMLLGTDTTSSALGQTDVVIIVSVNRDAETVAMWHIPRDLLVYIPGYTIDRINRAWPVGAQNGWPGGGPSLLKETIRYNFGIEIDHYARVDFSDFQEIIAQLGGLTISVDCPITDWRLIDPETPLSVASGDDWEQYWERYTLPVGVQTLDPYMALWYARSRVTTSDLDRGRRQIDILRAMWREAREQGIFSQVTTLWPQALEIIDTDMGLEDVLGFVPLAVALDLSDIERYNMQVGVHMENWTTPDDGRSVLLPIWDTILALAQDFVTPPTGLRLNREARPIEVYDGTLYGQGWGRVAADRLAWEGFAPVVQETRNIALHEVTLIYDYTGETKGSELSRIQEILRAGNSQVQIEPDPDRTFDYRVVVGRSYNACIYGSSADEVEIPDRPRDIENQG